MSKLIRMAFTEKEANYIEMALIARIWGLDELGDKGNVPHVRRVNRRLLRKVRSLRGVNRG